MSKDVNNGQSRREFLGRSVAALAAASFLPSAFSCTGKSVAAPAPVDTAAEAGKVNSKFGGVQIGTITYSWRSMPGGLENIIKYCQEANISSIELMGGDLEAYLGAPENPMMKFFRQQASQPAAKPGEKPAAPRRMGPPKFTPEQQAELANVVRFAIDRSRLTKEHLDYVIAAVKALYEDRESIPNMRIVWGHKLPMRHFHAFLEPYPNEDK